MSIRASGRTRIMQHKLALVIAIHAFDFSDQMPNLPHIVNNADDVSHALREIGFDVTKESNLKRREMKNVLNDFEDSIQPGDIVLFYFAGHAIHWKVCIGVCYKASF